GLSAFSVSAVQYSRRRTTTGSESWGSIADPVPGREDVRLVTRLREQVLEGFVDQSADLRHIDADETAPGFPDLTADDDRIDVPDIGGQYDRADGVVRRVQIDIVCPDHDDVSLRARRQHPARARQAGTGCTIDRGAFQNRSDVDGRRSC